MSRSGFPSPAALFRTAQPGMQLLRGIAPLIVGGAMVFAVRYLPLAEATVILFAGPFMRRRACQAHCLASVSGRRAGSAWSSASSPSSWWRGPGFSDVSVYAIFPLLAALFYAVFQLLTRHLSAAKEAPDDHARLDARRVGLAVSVPLAFIEWVPVSATALGLVRWR